MNVNEVYIVFGIVFTASYVLHAMGVTIGYHRLLTHRSFTCPKIVEYFWILAGYLAFEGSPIWWVTMHRAHHRYQDTPLDPHSPSFGLFRSHIGWMLNRGYPSHIDPSLQSKDLLTDPVYRFLEQDGDWHKAHRLAFVIGIFFRVAIFVCFGWVAALASLLAGFAVLQIPIMLNVICHIPKLGYKSYATNDDSVNVWWVGLLAFGEGWHNNHHASPSSARTGMKLHELDLSWLTIRAMEKLRLASGINEVTPAQLAMMDSARKSKQLTQV
ncbi:MAG: fatty acid desaturase [Candidatus Obscuribacterales bacterium]|nr:fatty acid desaturase [Candidatus Obscuribacterales bacterium]